MTKLSRSIDPATEQKAVRGATKLVPTLQEIEETDSAEAPVAKEAGLDLPFPEQEVKET